MEQLQENTNQQEVTVEPKKYPAPDEVSKRLLIWVGIFLFFILFFLGELFYFYPSGISSSNFNLTANQIIEENKLAQLNNKVQKSESEILPPGIQSKAIIVTNTGNKKIIYQKNIYQKMPIASLAKLMSAIVILENFHLDDIVKISSESVSVEGDVLNNFIPDEKISIRSLFYALLISSSNKAAMAISENTPDKFAFKIFNSLSNDASVNREQKIKAFVALMNKKAQELNLNSTYFSDPTGLSEQTYSTAYDLSRLSYYILENYPIIFDITKIQNMEIVSADGGYVHKLVNTDKLLDKMDGIIMGGKTGYTDEAGQCLLVLVKIGDEIFSNIILNSPDRFGEMQQLIELINNQKF